MNCPKCASTDVRLSRQAKWGDIFYGFSGRRAFRCRDCQLRFFAVDPGGHSSSSNAHPHDGIRMRKRLRRRILEVTIFAIMLVIFFVFLHYLTREQAPGGDSSTNVPSLTEDVAEKVSAESENAAKKYRHSCLCGTFSATSYVTLHSWLCPHSRPARTASAEERCARIDPKQRLHLVGLQVSLITCECLGKRRSRCSSRR